MEHYYLVQYQRKESLNHLGYMMFKIDYPYDGAPMSSIEVSNKDRALDLFNMLAKQSDVIWCCVSLVKNTTLSGYLTHSCEKVAEYQDRL